MMYKIQTLNNISDVIHQSLTAERYLIAKEEPVPDGILVRSASMHLSLIHISLSNRLHPPFCLFQGNELFINRYIISV